MHTYVYMHEYTYLTNRIYIAFRRFKPKCDLRIEQLAVVCVFDSLTINGKHNQTTKVTKTSHKNGTYLALPIK